MHARDQSSIFSTGGKFCPDYGLLLELHALTLVARSYALLASDIDIIYSIVSPDEGEVDSKRTMDSRAVDTDEHTVCDRGPGGVLSSTIKTHLH